MSEQFTPLSWDELLADIPTITDGKASRREAKEAKKADRSKKAASGQEKAEKKSAPAKSGKSEKKSAPAKSGKSEKKPAPAKSGKSEKKPAPAKGEKQETKSAPAKGEKQETKSAPAKSGKQEKKPAKSEKQETKSAEAQKIKDNAPDSAPVENGSDEVSPIRQIIDLPPVPQPIVSVEPVIDLPATQTECIELEPLVIDLSRTTRPSSEPLPDDWGDMENARPRFRFRRKPKFTSPDAADHKRSLPAILFCALRRLLLTIVVVAGILGIGLYLVLSLIFNGPSPTARDVLTMSLSEASGTKWVPGLFLDEQLVEQIRKGDTTLLAEDEDTNDLPPVEINTDTSLTADSDEWKDCPDGIRIEQVNGDTYQAYVMLVRDPSRIYLATSTNRFSKSIPGSRITEQIEKEGAVAAVNAGAFFDNGTSDPAVGSVPLGLTISQGNVVWETGRGPEQGFVGFNQDNVLVVSDTMTADEAREKGIRDGCSFGPVLIQNGAIRNEAYNSASGYNPRTAIGQRADGSVILVCIDGRQSQSIGGTYADIIDIMVEYQAVNACNLDGGSSTTMLYRDETGRYGTAGQVHMINNYSLLQSQPRKMPTFIMVRPEEEG